MLRKHLFRTILIVAVIAWSVYALVPNWQLGNLKKQQLVILNQLSNLSDIPVPDLSRAVTLEELNRVVAEKMKRASSTQYEEAMALVKDINELEDKINKNETRSIKRGLDLLGGTYLVYEVDLPQLMTDLSKNKDSRFDSLIAETAKAATAEDVEFFDALKNTFDSKGVKLSRYFGRKGQSDDDIINDLIKEADDAIDRTLKILRNRIDQFGVSEPNILEQGSQRIVIELAGIQDIERAKKIIKTTALLEFKLLKDADIADRVRDRVDRILKSKRTVTDNILTEAKTDTSAGIVADTTVVASEDTSFEAGNVSKDKEVSIGELFGDTSDEPGQDQSDTSLVVDEETFADKPFTSLLRRIGRGEEIAVPVQNKVAVDRILQLPEVQSVLREFDSEFHWSKDATYVGKEGYWYLFLLKREPELLGRVISDADVQIGGGQTSLTAGEAKVTLEMNSDGAKTFARVTGMNVGKRLAIVLDSRVASAPNIKEKIPFGSASIDGMADIKEAQDLALILRAGALPAPVESIEERTIGPSLGRDSIEKGTFSAILGLLLVVVFMVLYYRASGVVANFALLLNIILIMAVLGQFHATLTLPGVAGIILTIGMAVDANVLIFERIREERRAGKDPGAAIKIGYGRAFITILDANVTTLITALVLYQFGTGPIRGFAVTLSVGILASMFTAIVVTRAIFDFFTEKYSIKKLSI